MPAISLAEREYFLFDAQDTSSQDLVGGTEFSDSKQQTVTGGTTVTYYSYTYNGITGKARIQIFLDTLTRSFDITLYKNGTAIASATGVVSDGTTPVIDVVTDVTAGDVFDVELTNNGTDVAPVMDFKLVSGIPLPTTEGTVVSTALPSYRLEYVGRWKFEVGVRCRIDYIRASTTAAFTLKINGQELQNYTNAAGDDGVTPISGYGTGPLADPVVISGLVGASGDTVIIVHAYIQVCLRGKQSDKWGILNNLAVVKDDKYSVYIVDEHAKSLDGTTKRVEIVGFEYNGWFYKYTSGYATDVAATNISVSSPFAAHVKDNVDTLSLSFIRSLHIVEVG